ncbi:MAG: hypothetical protein WCP21_02405 [Armatimonadota bacterium]
MNSIFSGDFTTSALSDWTVEQHVPEGYSDFVIRDRKLVFLDAGNRLLPNIPALESFVMRGAFEADWGINNNEFSLQVFFAYDPHRRRGLVLDFGSDGTRTYAKLVSPEHADTVAIEIEESVVHDGVVHFELELKDRELSLKLNSREHFRATIEQDCRGLLALTRGAFLGELRLLSLTIESDDTIERESLWTDLRLPFAPINGMDIPIVWTVNATRVGSAARVEVELSGGEKTRPDVPWFPYHCHYVEVLDRPYLRIESQHSVSELSLSDDALVLAIPHKQYFYSLAHQDPPWPFRKTFYLRDVAPDSIVFAGYKAYGNRAVNKHLEVETPYETVHDAGRGEVIYSGQALPPDAVVVDLKSPADKQLCRDLPVATVDYGRALAFAQANHYFAAGEECAFQFEVFARNSAAQELLAIDCRLESAFFEPLTGYTAVAPSAEAETLALDIQRLCTTWFTVGAQEAGVYHLRFRLRDGVTVLHESYRAFEVLGATESGAAASRLPKCFSMSNEVKGQDTDNFDPWRADCVDVSHYVSIVAGYMPHFAREKRLWELLKLYQREWFLWLGGRVMQDFTLDHNHDLIQGCDYLLPGEPNDVFYRPCARQFYHPQLVAILCDFAVATGFRVAEIKAFAEAGAIPDKATFQALVSECFYEWIDYFWERRIKELLQFKAEVSQINPHARISSYGPVAVYGGLYKTAHASTYAGLYKPCPEMEGFRDGYFVLEDYPHACRYSIHSGPFFLAGFKALAPAVTVYPELYNETGDKVPCPDAAVARAWPSYGMWDGNLPINASIKRVLEYVYGCVWHDGQGFNYWQDYGFHTRVWERERFEALLKVWGFVDRARPRRPWKANAFVCNEDCCRNHKLYYDEYPGDGHEAYGDLFNTAEEGSAYCYEMSRTAGQNAGFVTDFSHLSSLSAADIDTLVLPPLTRVSADDLHEVRRLHEQGVSLLAFEEVGGLEDLFGVVAGSPVQVHEIGVNGLLAGNPLAALARLEEYTEHPACVGKYRAATADTLLDAEVPVLFLNQTPWGKTALYNIPPTAVRRQNQFNRVAMGRASISKLINEATRLVLRHLSDPAVLTNAGKIIAFEDEAGKRHIIVAEDAHPFPASTIRAVITINLPGLQVGEVRCDKEFTIVSQDEKGGRLSLRLDPDEFAIISLP